jgi:hypothetical protein
VRAAATNAAFQNYRKMFYENLRSQQSQTGLGVDFVAGEGVCTSKAGEILATACYISRHQANNVPSFVKIKHNSGGEHCPAQPGCADCDVPLAIPTVVIKTAGSIGNLLPLKQSDSYGVLQRKITSRFCDQVGCGWVLYIRSRLFMCCSCL